jgi:hypothetical protein
MRQIASLIGLCCLLLPSAALADGKYTGSYFCTETIAAGLYYDTEAKAWTSGKFKPSEGYVLTLVLDNTDENAIERYAATTREIVGLTGESPCTAGGEPVPAIAGFLICDSGVTHYQFNLELLRFSRVNQVGYVSGFDNNNNDPVLSAGTCAKTK